jgi:NAD(P)-dependent dehydrogenase (short-subunit alcohol dehydrogenase family)
MTPAEPTMDGRVCLVTGTNGGMGKVVVTDLARRGATVVLVCRDCRKGEAAQREIVEATGNSSVDLLLADLSDQSATRRLAEEFLERYSELHVLVNNAGAHTQQRRLSVDGIELNLAINHLASFLLTNLLVDTLKASAPSRVVNVAFAAMKNSLDLDDLQRERRF